MCSLNEADNFGGSSIEAIKNGEGGAAEDEEEKKTCRICYLEGGKDDPFISPCECSGTMEYVHEDCMKLWLSKVSQPSEVKTVHEAHCEVCGSLIRFRIKEVWCLNEWEVTKQGFTRYKNWLIVGSLTEVYLLFAYIYLLGLIQDENFTRSKNIVYYLVVLCLYITPIGFFGFFIVFKRLFFQKKIQVREILAKIGTGNDS